MIQDIFTYTAVIGAIFYTFYHTVRIFITEKEKPAGKCASCSGCGLVKK